MPGRKPKPSALKELAGNPGKRRLNRSEPRLKVRLPPAPPGMSADERKRYRSLGKMLVDMGVMTQADGTALALLAVSLAQYWQARQQVSRLGPVIKTSNGNLIQNPYLPVANKAWEQCAKLLGEFGLTPSSRSRVSAEQTKELSIAEMLFADVGQWDDDEDEDAEDEHAER